MDVYHYSLVIVATVYYCGLGTIVVCIRLIFLLLRFSILGIGLRQFPRFSVVSLPFNFQVGALDKLLIVVSLCGFFLLPFLPRLVPTTPRVCEYDLFVRFVRFVRFVLLRYFPAIIVFPARHRFLFLSFFYSNPFSTYPALSLICRSIFFEMPFFFFSLNATVVIILHHCTTYYLII